MTPQELDVKAGFPTQALSIVVPVFNEDAVLPEFHRRLAAALAAFLNMPRLFTSMTEARTGHST